MARRHIFMAPEMLHHYEDVRRTIVHKIQQDLHTLALQLGQTEDQASSKIDTLFATFSGDWSLYILTGSPAIKTSIQNDATIPWLDTDVSGQTIRQRLLNRLN